MTSTFNLSTSASVKMALVSALLETAIVAEDVAVDNGIVADVVDIST